MDFQKQTLYTYDSELDILHIYSAKIEGGVKGCISIGDYKLEDISSFQAGASPQWF